MSSAPPVRFGRDIVLPFVTVTLIWGSTWLVIRDQVSSVPPSWSVTYRFIVAAVGMFAVALVQRHRLRLSPRALGLALFLGFTQFMLNFNFVYRAEIYLTSGVVAVLYALLMVPNSLMAWAFFGQRPSRAFLLGSAVSIVGVALLFLHEYRLGQVDPDKVLLGIGFGLGGVFAASCANVVQLGQTARQTPVAPLLGWAMLFGAVIDALWAYALDGPPIFETRPAYLAGIVYLGLAGSVVTFPLYFRLIQRMGAGRAAYSAVAIPVIAMLLSTLFEGYAWQVLPVAGALLAMAGLLIALQPRSSADSPST